MFNFFSNFFSFTNDSTRKVFVRCMQIETINYQLSNAGLNEPKFRVVPICFDYCEKKPT